MTPLIDIGVNLTSKQFRGDLEDVISRAHKVGVGKMVITGLSAPLSWRARDLAARYPGALWSTAGVHPHNSPRTDRTTMDDLSRLSKCEEVVAIGEMGLDYNRKFSPPTTQRRVFEQQLRIAADCGKPIFLHERDASSEFAAILREHRSSLCGGVVHCFTSSMAALETYVELDLHFGITGAICDERRWQHLPAVVAKIPSDRLMIETDAPFLLPRDLRPRPSSRRNEPMYLPQVLAAVARARGADPEAIAALTTKNAERFFGLLESAARLAPGETDQDGSDVRSASGSVRSASGSVSSAN